MIYKFLPSRYVDQTVDQGRILFRNLSYFRQHEDAARGDVIEGIHVDDPDNPVTIEQVATGRIVKGDFRFLNAIDQDRVFAFCASRSYSEDLYEQFKSDACIVIKDTDRFFQKCATAARHTLSIDRVGLIHRSVEYFEANKPARMSVKYPPNLPFFKHHTFASQDEYRGVYALKGGFTLTQKIVTRGYSIRDEIASGKPAEQVLILGSLAGLVEVRYRSRAP